MPLTKEENEVLCQVGPGTLVGNLLRRYCPIVQESLAQRL